jgi:hypothetical protein
MNSEIIGMYSCFENQLDFNTRVRLVKYQDGILYHSAPLKISAEMVQDLKAHGVDVEYQLLDTLKSNTTQYFEMNQQDIEHASSQIPELKYVFRDMKINEILNQD